VITHVLHYLCDCQPVFGYFDRTNGLEVWIHPVLSEQPN
jgi:hypothetical protein